MVEEWLTLLLGLAGLAGFVMLLIWMDLRREDKEWEKRHSE